MDLLTCDKCGYIEPYFHEEMLVTCDCKVLPVKIEETLRRIDEFKKRKTHNDSKSIQGNED